MPVSTSRQGRDTPRTVSHETVIRRGGAQAPTVKFTLDDAGSVVATSIRIASRDGDFGPTSHATRTVTVPLRPQAPRTVAFATGASHPAPDAGVPNFDVDFAWMRAFSARASRLASPTATPPAAIQLDIIAAPVVAPHERPVWAHDCPTCRDEWSIRATTETPVLSGICTGHPAATCPECTENHATRVTRATVMLAKAENALATARTPKQYARAEKRVAHWKSALSALGHTPQGMCPRHESKPVNDPATVPANFPRQAETLDVSAVAWLHAVEELAREHSVKREHGVDASTADALRRAGVTVPTVPLGAVHTIRAAKPAPRHRGGGDNASTLYATLYAARPSWERDALGEGIAAGTTIAPDPTTIRRADVKTAALVAAGDARASRPVTTHDAYALRGVGVVGRDDTFEGRVVAERWRGRARALDRVCAVCRRAECPSVRRTGQPCGAVAVQPPPLPPPPRGAVTRPRICIVCRRAECPSVRRIDGICLAVQPAESVKRPQGVYVAPTAVSSHGRHGSTYRAPDETASKPRVPRTYVEPIAAQAEGIRGARTTPERAHGPYETPPRGRIVR